MHLEAPTCHKPSSTGHVGHEKTQKDHFWDQRHFLWSNPSGMIIPGPNNKAISFFIINVAFAPFVSLFSNLASVMLQRAIGDAVRRKRKSSSDPRYPVLLPLHGRNPHYPHPLPPFA